MQYKSNKNCVDLLAQFDIDCDESVFKLDTVCGVIPPCSHKTILVHFHPVHAINYYRRVSCLVHNQVCVYYNNNKNSILYILSIILIILCRPMFIVYLCIICKFITL